MDRPTLARIHWQDGMMLRSHHLKQVEGRSDEIARLAHHYLMPRPGICIDGEPRIECNLSGSTLTATLHSGVVLVSDGRLLVVDASRSEALPPLTTSKEIDPETDGAYPVGIEIVEGTDLVGSPDPDEDPPRIPYCLDRMQLLLGEDLAFGRSSALQIGEVAVANHSAKLSENYIPPCMWIGASTVFVAAVERFRLRLKSSSSSALAGCKEMKAGLERDGVPNSPFFLILQQMASTLGAAHEWLPSAPYLDPPEAAFRPIRSVLRAMDDLFTIFFAARNTVINDLVMREELPSRDQVFFESLRKFLAKPIDLSDLRRAVDEHHRFLEDVEGIIRYVSGSEKPIEGYDPEIYPYRGTEYRRIPYKHRTIRAIEGRQSLHIADLEPKGDLNSILVIMRCTQGTPEERERFEIRFGINERQTWPWADRSDTDATTEKNHIICVYPRKEKGEAIADPRVRQLTLISGAVDFSHLEKAPMEDLRIYGA